MIYALTITYTLLAFVVAYMALMTALTAWDRGKAIVDTQ